LSITTLSKNVARQILPSKVWTFLRTLRLRLHVERFRRRVVEHDYGGHRLSVLVADGLAQAWYDRDWKELPEVALLRTSRLKPGALVFDLGAHQGVVALILSREVAPNGKVVAVEANPHNREVAEQNRALNGAENLTTVHAAVSDKAGFLDFNLGLNGQVDEGDGEWGVQRVSAVTVDSLAKEHGRPDVLFIDVEGFECRVLEGASDALAGRPDCFIEVHSGHGLERFGGSVAALLGRFREAGYELFAHTEGMREPGRLGPLDAPPEGRFFLTALARPS
jgi:FkbM family methyltransferase